MAKSANRARRQRGSAYYASRPAAKLTSDSNVVLFFPERGGRASSYSWRAAILRSIASLGQWCAWSFPSMAGRKGKRLTLAHSGWHGASAMFSSV
jgi:hypothetical protein